jgi:PIN domain nuclease of toxin-antitoxin system
LILLDTHIVLWLAFEPGNLSRDAQSAIQQERDTGGGLCISSVTLLELAILATRGRYQHTMAIELFLEEIETTFHVLPITARGCAKVLQLPADYPRDPADRIIGATALVEGMQVVTADAAIRKSRAVPTIW